jgi:hypothetical protein
MPDVTVPVGLTTTLGDGLAGESAAGCGARTGTVRREPESRPGVAVPLPAGLSTMTGGKSGDADCCANAGEMPKGSIGTSKLVKGTRNRRRPALMEQDMVRPRLTSVARHSEPSLTAVRPHSQ